MTAGIVGAPRVSRGQTFGRLRVVGFADTTNRDGPRLVACRCACGRERQTNARNLTSGRVRACHDCARRDAFTLAEQLRNHTPTDFRRAWRQWLDRFTAKQRRAHDAKLRALGGGYVPDETRASLVVEVMTEWLRRTLAAMSERSKST
jgi:hypothetical protein